MKKTILFLFLFLSVLTANAQDINWMSFEEAVAKQKRNPKPIFMDVYTEWCAPCKIMDRGTYQDPEVIEFINKNFHPVKFNAEGNEKINILGNSFSNPGYDPERKGRNSSHQLTKFLKVPSYPTMYVIDNKGTIKEIIEGPKDPATLLKELKS